MSTSPVALILGATGKTGSHLVNLLEQDGGSDHLSIRVAVRKPEQAETFTKRGIPTVHLDLDDLSTYESALQGVQRLFMVTGYTVDMLSQGKNLTDAALKAGVEYIVHVGTFHQPDRPQTKLIRHYIWHQLIETYIEASGIAWTHLHPNAFMQNFFGAVQDGKLRMFFGHERVGLVDCFDIARVAAAALREPEKHASGRYFLSVEALTMTEAAQILSSEIGKPITYEALPASDLRKLPIGQTMESAYFECIVRQMELLQGGQLPDFADVYDNIGQIIGEKPIMFRDFVRNNLANFAAG
ncbi:NmrA family NAD(P)-binding protein [Iningainema tapete]|uniref:NmrA family NAD(P)-binding protein n=1 Tax=Iningainema tapete BLCC-T55 TaxID=2748662 RepID=A0A8J7BXW5_9CYAN|nr:NmrA family NAD(P)-binding protein [Iningainema tapete]MBD2774512.1 NmrA family NAD(P)-binding protein [Iningainema tapete BLCC-T55]